MRYEIYSPYGPNGGGGEVFNTILASPEFMAEHYPGGNYRIVPEAPATVAPKQWSIGGFISLFTAAEWDRATARAATDIIAKQFMAIMNGSSFIQSDDERLLRGLDYFRYLGDITRTNAEILA